MAGYIFRRTIYSIITLFVLAAVTFGLMHAAPGGPWDVLAPDKQGLSPSALAILNAKYGLDKSLPEQYLRYMIGYTDVEGEFVCGAVCGNLGDSLRMRGQTVQHILFEPSSDEGDFWDTRFSYTLRMALLAATLGIVIGIPAGVFAALKQNSWIDYVVIFLTTIGISVPAFVMAVFLIIIFAVQFKLVPVIPKWENPTHWILPALVLSFGAMASLARYTRAQMLETMRQDYIRTARAKGLIERVVVIRHMLRNSLIPVVTVLGPTLAGLLVGSFIIEQMFSLPGMGNQFVTSIFNRDYSMILGTTLFYGLLVVIANFVVDLTYSILDPRIRLG